ncbi:MAG: hypothetical protein JSS83_01880 [Cyanobacteria bacterium SZAS LIN-3]|nr:hypothetical protein [Cyanobacteria bacterium SZAS LIN-3]
MCIFITAVVPAEVDLKKSQALLQEHGMRFKSLENPHLQGQIEGAQYLCATGAICECSTVLGSNTEGRAREDRKQEFQHEIEKLRRKGWSQQKIERSLADKTNAANRDIDSAKAKHEAELTNWCNFIHAFLAQPGTPTLGLLLHMYSGGLATERIRIKRFEKLRVSGKLPSMLTAMENDVLYTFTKAKGA